MFKAVVPVWNWNNGKELEHWNINKIKVLQVMFQLFQLV